MKRLKIISLEALVYFLVLFSYIKSFEDNSGSENKYIISDEESTCQASKKDGNCKWSFYKEQITSAMLDYEVCPKEKCSCHYPLITKDLSAFSSGISSQVIQDSMPRGTIYQVINHRLYRSKQCMFPSRCSGVEHFILKVIRDLPNLEFVLNDRDWPQVPKGGPKLPVFSFSKTSDYHDITYPAWTFWEGGPATSVYPTGLGRFDQLRKVLMTSAEKTPWREKKDIAFFRGSRTSSERDALVYLSREQPHLVDAQYTKNQAWKSDADTLYAPPAQEVPLEGHCEYKFLFNFRGVAASFRFKHLFLCGSLVFHVGAEWIEFFYPRMKPWLHFIPVPSGASKEEIRDLIEFAKANDDLVKGVAERGFEFIKNHVRIKDVLCYWRRLLRSYAELLSYEVVRPREGAVEVTGPTRNS